MTISRRSMIGGLTTAIAWPLLQQDRTTPDDPPKDINIALDENKWTAWERYDGAIEHIGRLPKWPRARDFSAEEWNKYIAAAIWLQKSRPACVEALTILAMLTSLHYEPATSRLEPWRDTDDLVHMNRITLDEVIGCKLMLLFRLMFMIPMPERAVEFRKSGFGIYGCANYPAEPLEEGFGHPYEFITSPVYWEHNRPRLTAGSSIREPGGIVSDYQPQIEYRYLCSHFSYRNGLGELLRKDTLIDHPLR